jgi:hypothetical protein
VASLATLLLEDLFAAARAGVDGIRVGWRLERVNIQG